VIARKPLAVMVRPPSQIASVLRQSRFRLSTANAHESDYFADDCKEDPGAAG
jgi:hypothetical protein